MRKGLLRSLLSEVHNLIDSEVRRRAWLCLLPKSALIFIIIIILNWKMSALQYYVGSCHTSTWISHRYTHVPFLLNLPSTSHPVHPSSLSQSTSLSSLHQTVNSHWLSILQMGLYMFQCCSSNSSHPLLPPLCPKVKPAFLILNL